ncbi:aminodeoxychorismate lyase [Marinobacterium aestuariivivens]|uniref:Aminodeoxychorismate lyase n=1 Tax=Marinobacterium aestuariivivens TaxID=1698799 RepID=A0ABW2A8X9_9GAMM
MSMSLDPVILVNGILTDSLPVTDRGLAYGDGLFETVQLQDGRPLLLEAHFERLLQGCRRLGIASEGLVARLRDDLSRLASMQDLAAWGVLKITVTRGAGGRGYLPLPDLVPTRILMLSRAPVHADAPAVNGVRVRLCDLRLALSPRLAGIKHLNRLEQVLARAEWTDPAIREGLLLDQEGWLVEGTMSNLFWVCAGRIFTPQLDRSGVSGIVRNRLLALASEEGLEVEEGRYPLSHLEQADEAWLCNSLIDIWPVTALAERCWPVGPVTRRLQQLLTEDYRAC